MEKQTKPDIIGLQQMGLAELQSQYKELFPDRSVPFNLKYLLRQIAHKLQERAFGGLSKETQTKINALIATYDPVNRLSFKTKPAKKDDETGFDTRLPIPGSIITKSYKGTKLEVKVLERGFEYEGKLYRNLSSVAGAITGAHWNGFAFFGIGDPNKWRRMKRAKTSDALSTQENPPRMD